MSRYSALLLPLVLCAAVPAATLEYLTLDDMTARSTAIVRGTVIGSHTTVRGPVVYTLYTLQISERLKGRPAPSIDVAVPGGVAEGIRQTFAGAPELQNGGEYVVFAWKSKSGLNMILGLSQGLFRVMPGDAGPDLTVSQTATGERVLSNSGQEISTSPVRMSLTQLRSQVKRVVEGQ